MTYNASPSSNLEALTTTVDSANSSRQDRHKYIRLYCGNCDCHHWIDVPLKCGDRFCTVCQRKRQMDVRRRIKHLIKTVKLLQYQRIRMLTLTVPNSEVLTDQVDHLIKSFRKFRNRKYFKQAVNGGLYVIEVKRGEKGWHAHLHIILQSDFLLAERLKKMWKSCSGGRSLHIALIPLKMLIHYVTKYITKSSDEELDETASKVLRGRRLFQPFGDWHGIAFSCPPEKYIPVCPCCQQPAAWFQWDFNPHFDRKVCNRPPPLSVDELAVAEGIRTQFIRDGFSRAEFMTAHELLDAVPSSNVF